MSNNINNTSIPPTIVGPRPAPGVYHQSHLFKPQTTNVVSPVNETTTTIATTVPNIENKESAVVIAVNEVVESSPLSSNVAIIEDKVHIVESTIPNKQIFSPRLSNRPRIVMPDTSIMENEDSLGDSDIRPGIRRRSISSSEMESGRFQKPEDEEVNEATEDEDPDKNIKSNVPLSMNYQRGILRGANAVTTHYKSTPKKSTPPISVGNSIFIWIVPICLISSIFWLIGASAIVTSTTILTIMSVLNAVFVVIIIINYLVNIKPIFKQLYITYEDLDSREEEKLNCLLQATNAIFITLFLLFWVILLVVLTLFFALPVIGLEGSLDAQLNAMNPGNKAMFSLVIISGTFAAISIIAWTTYLLLFAKHCNQKMAEYYYIRIAADNMEQKLRKVKFNRI